MKDHNRRNHTPSGCITKHLMFVPEQRFPFDLDNPFIEPTSVLDTVTIPRSEYNELIAKSTVNDLLRKTLSRKDYISADDIRNFLSIDKAPREDAKA